MLWSRQVVIPIIISVTPNVLSARALGVTVTRFFLMKTDYLVIFFPDDK